MFTDTSPSTVLNQGKMFIQSGKLEPARLCFEFVVRHAPSEVMPRVCLAQTYLESNDFERAADVICQSERMGLTSPELRNQRVMTYLGLNDFDAAMTTAQKHVSQFNDAMAHAALGSAYLATHQFDKAADSYASAIQMDGNIPQHHNNYGVALQESNRSEEAINAYHEAWRIDPSYTGAKVREGMLQLLAGNWQKGWELYESRLGIGQVEISDGIRETLNSTRGTLCLCAEQGIGDIIQFARYAKSVASMGWNIELEVPKSLVRLLQESHLPGVARVCETGESSATGLRCPILSLGYILSLTEDDFHSDPYILKKAPTDKTIRRIGMCWKGAQKNRLNRQRSINLSDFFPLFEWAKSDGRAEIVAISQDCTEEERAILNKNDIKLKTHFSDFFETAQEIGDLNAMISVDTSAAHLAGAMGVPTYLLLRTPADWRWGIDGASTRWYPGTVLIRQRARGDWRDVVDQLVCMLSNSSTQ